MTYTAYNTRPGSGQGPGDIRVRDVDPDTGSPIPGTDEIVVGPYASNADDLLRLKGWRVVGEWHTYETGSTAQVEPIEPLDNPRGGRPPIGPRVQTNLPEWVVAELEGRKRLGGGAISALIRQAVEERLAEQTVWLFAVTDEEEPQRVAIRRALGPVYVADLDDLEGNAARRGEQFGVDAWDWLRGEFDPEAHPKWWSDPNVVDLRVVALFTPGQGCAWLCGIGEAGRAARVYTGIEGAAVRVDDEDDSAVKA